MCRYHIRIASFCRRSRRFVRRNDEAIPQEEGLPLRPHDDTGTQRLFAAHAPDASLCEKSVRHKRFERVPIIGWLMMSDAHYERFFCLARQVASQLEQRTAFPILDWRVESQDAELAENISKAIAERLHWPNHYLLPTDPLAILLIDPDGMGIFEASFEIKKERGVAINLKAISPAGELRDLVEHVTSVRSRETSIRR